MKMRPPAPPRAYTLNRAALNAFCPTGEGGGVDPTCPVGGGVPGTGTKPDTSSMPKLGEGSARRVFDAGDGTVIKEAKNRQAKKDNKNEMRLSGKSELFAKVVDGAKDGSWVRQERVAAVTKDELADAFGVSAADRARQYDVTIKDPWGLPVQTKGDWMLAATHTADGTSPPQGKTLGKFTEALKGLKASVPGLDIGDLAYAPQWGRSGDGKMKIADYSLTENARTTNASRAKKRKPVPVGKLDPTRTGTRRRLFARQLRRRFRLLRGALYALLVREDAFGLGRAGVVRLTDNVFCPTGDGGGVDPSCSPGASGGGEGGPGASYGGAFAYPAGYKPPKSLSPGVDAPGPNTAVPDAARPALTAKEAAAVTAYSDVNHYRPINEALKAGEEPRKVGGLTRLVGGPDPGGVHARLQEVFAKTPVMETPVVLKRGLNPRDVDKFVARFTGNEGKVVTLPGYQSSSHVSPAAGEDPFTAASGGYKGSVKLTIHAVHGLDVRPYSKFPGEDEVLLNHGSEYRVGRVEKRGGEHHIELFQLPPKGRSAKVNTRSDHGDANADDQRGQVRGGRVGRGRHPGGQPGAARADARGGGRDGAAVRTRTDNAAPGRFAFESTPEQLKKFEAWLRERFGKALTDPSSEKLWKAYLADGFKRGAGRAFDDVRKGEAAGVEPGSREADYLAGGRQQFLRSAFGRPETVEKVQLIASRTLTDLKGVTETMATRMVRALADGLTEGANPREVADRIDAELDIGLSRADTIARTEFIRAHAEGQLDAFDALGVAEIGVEVEWSSAGDDRTCFFCEGMEGKTFTIEDAHGLIPAHPNCLPGFVRVLPGSGLTATAERHYVGDVVVVRTAAGRELTCTPNHPILTPGGWVPAGLLDVGQHVVCDGRRDWELPVNDDDQHVPPRIEQVADAFRGAGGVVTAEVPVTAPNFHGDGRGSQVAVVRTHGCLRPAAQPAVGQQVEQGQLVLGHVDRPDLARPRRHALLLQRLHATAGRVVRRLDLRRLLFRGHLRPLQVFGLASSAVVNTGLRQPARDHVATDPELGGDGVLGHAGQVGGHDRSIIQQPVAPRLVFGAKDTDHDLVADAELGRQLASGGAGPVSLDQVVSVLVQFFVGHVYNLETVDGWYAANGIITHNCRCSFLPANVGERDRERTENVRRRVRNVFCPTGDGGGVDPTCAPSGGGGGASGSVAAAVDALPRATGPGAGANDLVPPFPADVKADPYPGQWVEERPDGGGGHLIVRGEKVTPRVEDVPLDALTVIQPFVERDRLLGIDPAKVGKPLVVRQGGRQYVYDGTHRATIARLAGRATVRAFVVDLAADGTVH